MGLQLLLVLVLVDMGGPMPLPIMGLTPLLELVPTHRYVYMHAIREACPYMELLSHRHCRRQLPPVPAPACRPEHRYCSSGHRHSCKPAAVVAADSSSST